jgi:uncharacterized membrane protein YqiK
MEEFVMHTITPLFLGAIMIALTIILGIICVFFYKEIRNN